MGRVGAEERTVMFAQREAEHLRELYWRSPNWVPLSDRKPPGPGWYALTVSTDIQDDGKRSYSVRPREFWDGERWTNQGGYVKPEAWTWEVRPWSGVVTERSIAITDK